jgi:SAM-dependent methyltransferase
MRVRVRISPDQPHLGGNIINGDPNTFSPSLWKWCVETYQIKTVFDVGCAEGHALKKFKEFGCEVIGIDGLQENVDLCEGLAQLHDITVAPYILSQKVDFVWCCELVEHIEEQYLSNLLTTMAQGKYIAMTFAVPGQAGHHHVNCQEGQYWIDALKPYGYEYIEADTKLARKMFPTRIWRRTGLIFKYG